MAALTDDRAQLLLAGAFVFAVALLGLTIVLSAGNYTASLAGDAGTVSQGEDAMTARASFAADVRSHLRVVNGRSGVSYSDRQDAVRAVTSRVAERTSDHYARQGRVVSGGTPSFTEGVRIKQQTSGTDETFREPGERAAGGSPAPTWELTDGGTVRNMSFRFSQLPTAAEDPFELRFRQSSGPEYDVEIGQAVVGGTTVWAVTVKRVGGTFSDTCTRPFSATADQRVDFSNALMDGTHCPALEALEMASTDYQVFVHTPTPGLASRNFARGEFWLIATAGDAGGPVLDTGDSVKRDQGLVYSVTVPFAYRSPAVEFESAVTVAPGEIP